MYQKIKFAAILALLLITPVKSAYAEPSDLCYGAVSTDALDVLTILGGGDNIGLRECAASCSKLYPKDDRKYRECLRMCTNRFPISCDNLLNLCISLRGKPKCLTQYEICIDLYAYFCTDATAY